MNMTFILLLLVMHLQPFGSHPVRPVGPARTPSAFSR